MQPIRLIISDAPESIPVPLEMQHQTIEVIIWPLDNDQSAGNVANLLTQDMPPLPS